MTSLAENLEYLVHVHGHDIKALADHARVATPLYYNAEFLRARWDVSAETLSEILGAHGLKPGRGKRVSVHRDWLPTLDKYVEKMKGGVPEQR